MLKEFLDHITSDFPELKQSKFLLACSGGVDSMVLTHLCYNGKMDFALAHCNFNLRGAESDNDALFVQNLARQYGLECFTAEFDTLDYVNQNKVSVQMAARTLRYDWFDHLMTKKKINTLVTAHHADDDLETFLINLSRGTGIEGLTGIPDKTERIARPLLQFSRIQIITYARENGLQWREDQSNADTKYLRNKIRSEIVPLLKELHPTFLKNFKKTQSHLQQTSTISEEYFQTLKKPLFFKENEVIKIAVEELKSLVPLEAHLYGLFHTYGFVEPNDLKHLLNAVSGKILVSKTHKLLKDRGFLLLSQSFQNDGFLKTFLIHEDEKIVGTPIKFRLNNVAVLGEKSNTVIYIDKNTLNYPLKIRKWKKGDYFYPFGMKGKKKLSKFFKDEKVDVFSKEKQWLLCSNEDIVWVIGRRLDNRFKVTQHTKEILRIEYIP
ncbi:tRNA lysidine(34) synthetase TilS [Maribacter sp. 2304DJ31-5]|uniref:tRNA lysidine(34) synthetase TilS n=1 Tax=Maribacter sp. 2304DJ31-5 TaxID=3386273 RepID=UPI0039BCB5F2